MFKIICAEIKKIVSKPGIYILSVLLAIILVLGVFIYKPTIEEQKDLTLDGVTFVDKYTHFFNDEKLAIENSINNSINSINNYSVVESQINYNYQEYIAFLTEKSEEVYDEYRDCISNNAYQEVIDSTRIRLVSSYSKLNNAIMQAFVDSQDGSYAILSTKENYEAYKDSYKKLDSWISISVQEKDLSDHLLEFETKYKSNFDLAIANFKYPTLSKSFVDSYTNENGENYSTLTTRLSNIVNEINANYEEALNNSNFNVKYAFKMDEFARLYKNTANTYIDLIKYELIVNAFDSIKTKDELKMLYLSDYSNFNSSSLLERNKYLFEHNKSENDFAKPLTIGVVSNNEVNAYDYSYFVLKIFSFVIIVYAIMSACHTIAGEVKDGSMRYLAIRPVSRTNLLLGKWLSIMCMSIILILFSCIISLCVGGAVFGWSSKTILTIFNGSFAVTMHPIAMIGIYLISMILELVVYSLLALLLSVVFKSDLMSMTILLVLYLLNTLLPVFVQGANTWLAYYPFSHMSFYALFGSSIYATNNNFFNLIFGAKIYAGTNAILTLSVIAIVAILLSLLAIRLFKKKEL